MSEPFLVRYQKSGKTWQERFDKNFPTHTFGHHHFIRERHLRACIQWEINDIIKKC